MKEAVTRSCFVQKVFLEISQNSQGSTSARVSFLIKLQASNCKFIEKETLTQVFSCEFCKISKNTFSYRRSLVAASVMTLKSDAKFEEKPTLGSKNDMRNLVNFNASSSKSGNLHFDVLLLPIAYKVSA